MIDFEQKPDTLSDSDIRYEVQEEITYLGHKKM